MKNEIIIICIMFGAVLFAACGKPGADKKLNEAISPVFGATDKLLSAAEINDILQQIGTYTAEPVMDDEVAVIETNMGRVVFSFFTEKAPKHANNFKRLANSGYYNGTTFHRVIPGFVVQGGDIMSRDSSRHNDGTGGPGWFLDAEFNDIPHEAGIISMARAQAPNSAGSQFFICLSKLPMLDNAYSVFGKVVTGMDVVKKIAEVDRDPADNPYERVVVERAYVVSRDQLTE